MSERHHTDWFLWTASAEIVLPDAPDSVRLRRAIGPDKARRVLIVLAAHANADGVTWPAIPTIMDESGLGRRAVTDGLAYLLAAKLVEKTGKVGRAVRYRLVNSRGLPDTSDPANSRGLPDTSRVQLSGEQSGEQSGPPRPEQEQEQVPPSPRTFDAALLNVMRDEGITSVNDVATVIEISARDPETHSPAARLLKVPSHRRHVVNMFRAERARSIREARDAAPRCQDCGYPVNECDALNTRTPGWCDGPERRAHASPGPSTISSPTTDKKES